MGICREREERVLTVGTQRDLGVFWLSPKAVGEQHVSEPWCSSLLFSVSQSRGLFKIAGECGQDNPNIITIH